MNDDLNDNFADYEAPGRKPLRHEIRKGREEAERRGETFLDPPSTRNLLGELESWWAELTPEQRVGEAIGNLWQPEFAMAGVLSKGGTRFFSFLTKTLEEASAKRILGGLKLGPSVTGGNILRKLQKLGVSKDELKYTGMEEFLRAREGKPVPIEEVLDLAQKNELRMKVRELAPTPDPKKQDLLSRMEEAQKKLDSPTAILGKDRVKEIMTGAPNYHGYELAKELEKDKRWLARMHGIDTLQDKIGTIEKQVPYHSSSYYDNYTLPDPLGERPSGYRERLYEPNKPGVDVEFTHRSNYPRAFAHSRSTERLVKMPRKTIFGNTDYVDEISTRHVEEFQADTHENVAFYLTGDPFKDAPNIMRNFAQELNRAKVSTTFDWRFDEPGPQWAQLKMEPGKEGIFVSILGEDLKGESIRIGKTFKDMRSLEEGLPKLVERTNLPMEPLLENFKGHLADAGIRPAADYPFKKDWWKVQVKDQLMEAARDPNVKALSFSGREVMQERVGYRVWEKGERADWSNMAPIKAGGKVDAEGRLIEDVVDPHGQFADELYEKKIPTFIEEEFGVKPVKGRTETPQGETPVWVVPLTDALRERLRKPQRLSFLTSEFDALA